MRRTQRGFTVVELAIVVVIIGVTAALAIPILTPDLDAMDVAAEADAMMRVAAQQATAGGAVRADVAQALGSTARARVHVRAGTPRVIAVERLQEDPLPASTARWIEVQARALPADVALAGWTRAADLTGGTGPLVPLTSSSELAVDCYPGARCDAATLFFANANGERDEARVALMPLGGSTVLYPSW